MKLFLWQINIALKTNKLIIGALALFFVACGKKEITQPTLKLDVQGLDTATVTIKTIESDSAIATTKLSVGQATVTFPLSRPQMLVVEINSVARPIVFFADVAEMTLSVNAGQTPPSFTVSGSSYQDSLDVFAENQQNNQMALNGLQQAAQQAAMASDSMMLNMIVAKLDSTYYGFIDYTVAFAKRNGVVGAMVAQRYIYEADYAELNDIYENVPVIFKDDASVVELKSRVDLLKNTQVGMRFTDIMQADTSGNSFRISSINGTYILIDFWASWCGPCRAANPELVALYRDFHPKGFEIVGVSLDDNAQRWKAAIVQDSLVWPQMSDLKGWQNEGAAAYAIRQIPQSILIDGQGFIVQKNLTPAELREFLSEKL